MAKISKHIKISNKKRVLILGQNGSGVKSSLLNHCKNLNYIFYQNVSQMKTKMDDFTNYDCIILFSFLSSNEQKYIEDFILNKVIKKDKQNIPLSYYIPNMALEMNKAVVFVKSKYGYKAYKDKKLKPIFEK